ncbi:phage holin family protein [Conyzicola nivalis]|uniref:Membrane protein n=1 Tax=Conyzicola nivalis TaxID=1477021 RepID=A0A916WJU4_9MICO|nr:phage holin family protein [Conyzicola nivalis]GGB08287.1 membrane protein [Conyzicola nivalis]
MSERELPKRSLFKLIGDLPGYLVELLRSELERLKQELVEKAKHLGVGVGLIAAGAFFAFFAFGVLVTAAILGIATALPAWLSALIVAFALLVITAILVLIGVKQLKRGVPPVPEETIASVKEDVNAIKGIGKRN